MATSISHADGPSSYPLNSPPTVQAATSDQINATAVSSQTKLVRTDNDALHLVFAKDKKIFYARSTDGGLTWSTPLDISNAPWNDSYSPSIASEGASIFVVWQNGGNISYRRSIDAGATWDPVLADPPVALDSQPTIHPQLPTIGAYEGRVFVAYSRLEAGNNEIFLKRSDDGGGTWQLESQMSSTTGDSMGPCLAGDGSQVYLFWEDNTGGHWNVVMRSSSNGGGAWAPVATDPLNVTNDGFENRNLKAVANGTDVYVVHQQQQASNYNVLVKGSHDSGASWPFSKAVTSSATEAIFPSAALGSGLLHVTWQDNAFRPSKDVRFRTYNSTSDSWGPTFTVTNETGGNWFPSLNPVAKPTKAEWVFTKGSGASFAVLFDWMFVGENAFPVLSWTEELNYTDKGLNPETGGTTAHVYRYKVNYTDADNEPPETGYPKAFIDRNGDGDYDDMEEMMSMNQLNSDDINYTDGKFYYYATTFPAIGSDYAYKFEVRDNHHTPGLGVPTASRNFPDIAIADRAPTLGWTGEVGFSKDGLDPSNGTTATEFNYRVRYMDLDNDPPLAGYPQVWIDKDLSGDYVLEEMFCMTAVDPMDDIYHDGKLFTFTTTLPSLGTYKYHFLALDKYGIENGMTDLPAGDMSGPVIDKENSNPVLNWTFETGYESDGVYPDEGSTSLIYSYRIDYMDEDNNTPAGGAVEVWIDESGDLSFNDSEKHAMHQANISDRDYYDGSVWEFNWTFKEVRLYHYKFYVKDTEGASAIGPAVSIKEGPDVTTVNHNPVLTFPEREGFADGLEPNSGKPETTRFTYMVNYSDPDDNPPLAGSPKVWVDADRDKVEEADEWHPMTETDFGDKSFIDGKTYAYSMNLTEVASTYSYRFMAYDKYNGPVLAGGPLQRANGPKVDPKENNPPTLEWLGAEDFVQDGLDPETGQTMTTFTYKVVYRDVDNDPPAPGFPQVWIDFTVNTDFNDSNEKQPMEPANENDTDFWDGRVYEFVTDDATRVLRSDLDYKYVFVAEDTDGAVAIGPATELKHAPVITKGNLPPTLEWLGVEGYISDAVEPDKGNTSTEFTFKVQFIDLDNNPPTDGYPQIWFGLESSGNAMEEEDQADVNTIDGKVFIYKKTFTIEGQKKYRFQAFDSFGELATGLPVEETNGPVVKNNKAPSLTFPKVAESVNGVSPQSGDVGTLFKFEVVYTDEDGDAPETGYPALMVDRDGDGSFSGDNEIIQLKAGMGGADFKAGVHYTVSIILEEGVHSFKFVAFDQFGAEAIGEATQPVSEGISVKKAGTEGEVGGTMVMVLGALAIALLLVGLVLGKVIFGRKKGGGGIAEGGASHGGPHAPHAGQVHEGPPPTTAPPPPPPPAPEPVPAQAPAPEPAPTQAPTPGPAPILKRPAFEPPPQNAIQQHGSNGSMQPPK